MKNAGIICEYNPFHNGHLYHIEQTKKAGVTHIIAVMSGNFVQRGDVSVAPKSAKVQAAVDSGADLVLELPTVWALSSAENFAKGAVSILKSTGVTDLLSFGCEYDNINVLKDIAEKINSDEVDKKLKEFLDDGISYAAARGKAVSEVVSPEAESIISQPNNILACEYLNALNSSNIEPIAIKRNTAHDAKSDDAFNKSASEIREMIFSGNPAFKKAMPLSSYEVLRQYAKIGQCPICIDSLNTEMMAVLRRMEAEDFKNFADVSEGLENRIYNAVKQSASINEILLRAKSKRYTMARLRRILICAYLGIGKGYADMEVPYIRVLGMNEKGKEILKEMRDKATKPVVMKYADINCAGAMARKIFEYESTAADLYSLAFKKPTPCGTEMTYNVYIKN